MNYSNIVDSLEESSLNFIWNAQSTNRKTGNVPTLYIGHTKEEAWDSCSGCNLRGNGCYAWSGSVAIGASSTRKAFKKGQDKTLAYAMEHKHKKAKMLRVSAIGDIGRCSSSQAKEIIDTAQKHGLNLVGYTHHWREAKVSTKWKGKLMASCERLQDADEAVSKGWRATCLVPSTQSKSFLSPNGNKVVICPAQTAEAAGKTLTCNDCRLCDASRLLAPIIGFQVHGSQLEKANKHIA